MTDQFENVKDDTKQRIVRKSPMQEIIDELEALSAENFKAGNLIAHYTLNTAIGVVKKYAG